jgi:glucose 1-dehydrogenase
VTQSFLETNGSIGPPAMVGQWAVVTGGSKGIGHGIAIRLLGAGANVVMVARGREALDDAVDAARQNATDGQEVLGIMADVADRSSIDALFDQLRSTLPALNVFVANAGSGRVTPFLELTPQEWDEIVALNLTGTVYACQQAARMMRDTPTANAAILVVSSIRATGARPGRLVYAATKAAVNQAVRVAASELAPYGIRVNALSPGITETPLTAANPDAFAEALQTVPLGRAAIPADLGEAAYFLCSPQAGFITGVNLIVDGGESLS